MLFRRYPYIAFCLLLLLAGCHRGDNKGDGEANVTRVPTDVPELPFLLEGDYTPDTGVTYKVLINDDTCFVVITHLTADKMMGYYYPVSTGSDCVERHTFERDRHWRDEREEAVVYLYQEPAFANLDDGRYHQERYPVQLLTDVVYGYADGYWVSMPDTGYDGYGAILSEGLKHSLSKNRQTLSLDIYCPDDDSSSHPLLLLLHGGGFYVGDKGDTAISRWCHHFASMGYVAVSANYRLGFLPTKKEITRAGYAALQDAHAAMRYLVANAEKYQIDTSLLFIGGCSAGSITSLNLAFMRDKDRPAAVTGKRRNAGEIEASGNNFDASFHIKAVANMWGALTNLNMLKNSHTDIISFHGDADLVVPYDNGFPFSDISKVLGQRMFDRMYGSLQIDRRARELGLRSKLYCFPDEGHSLHHHPDGSWNEENFAFIRDKMSQFFYSEIVGRSAAIEQDRYNNGHFYVNLDDASAVQWQIEGGYILRIKQNEIWIVWRNDAAVRSLHASGRYRNGLGFFCSYNDKSI